jgi:CheY-like chemotaxis protein
MRHRHGRHDAGLIGLSLPPNRWSQSRSPPLSFAALRAKNRAGCGQREEGAAMLNILIVEDEPLFAETLRHLVELNSRYVVTDVAEDSAGALAAVARRRPDLARVDLQLARGSTGFSVAAKFAELGIACLFTSGKAPAFPIPDLALGGLVKPFSEDDDAACAGPPSPPDAAADFRGMSAPAHAASWCGR